MRGAARHCRRCGRPRQAGLLCSICMENATRPILDSEVAKRYRLALDINRTAEANVIQARRTLMMLVSDLREMGWSWDAIGEAVGSTGSHVAAQYEHDFNDLFMTPPHVQDELWPPRLTPKYLMPKGPAKGTGGRPPILTEEQVSEIREDIGKLKLGEIAAKFGVDKSTIWRIAAGRNWVNS